MDCDLLLFERPLWLEKKVVCGIDEAGRGSLFGTVCASCVILNPEDIIEGLNDSKKLSAKKRESLFREIMRRAIGVGIGFSSAREVDELNVLQATFLAMKRAYDDMGLSPDIAFVDGNCDPGLPIETSLLVKGDARSASVAAASIVAKVTRDTLMLDMGKKYPGYDLEINKGYPTKAHREALRRLGPTPEHRITFLKNISYPGGRL